MCGIAGSFSYRQEAPGVYEAELLAVRDTMRLRGPDGEGLWISTDGRIGLAHRRLAIIDLSEAGAQPMATEDGRLRIVFNGEIYNYPELRQLLEGQGCRFRSNSDTEVLLHLYDARGPEMVHDLRGMFAFALWDEQRQGLLLARDPFGIKPLYYADDGRSLRFASQVKALLAFPELDTAPEPAGHVGFYLWGYVPEPYTLYRGIRALPAGCTLWLDRAGRRELRPYFRITEEVIGAEMASEAVSEAECKQRLHSALAGAVQQHLLADVPIGIFLSSGLDSCTITALALEVAARQELHTVTLGFREYEGTDSDEAPLAALMARACGSRHQTCWVRATDFKDELDKMMLAMDQPSIDGVNTYFISKVVAETGLKVALSGLGGDELFGGYQSFKDVPLLVRLAGPLSGLPGLGKGFRQVAAPLLKQFTSPKYAGILEYGGNYGGAYLLRRGLFMPWELPELLDPELVRAGWQELQPQARLDDTVRGIKAENLKVSVLEMVGYMRNQLLRDADWAGMAHSLEIRTPLVDVKLFRELVPLLLAHRPANKLDLAGTPRQALPPEVLRRRKSGFSIPVREWLVQAHGGGPSERGLRGWARFVMAASARPRAGRPQVLPAATGL